MLETQINTFAAFCCFLLLCSFSVDPFSVLTITTLYYFTLNPSKEGFYSFAVLGSGHLTGLVAWGILRQLHATTACWADHFDVRNFSPSHPTATFVKSFKCKSRAPQSTLPKVDWQLQVRHQQHLARSPLSRSQSDSKGQGQTYRSIGATHSCCQEGSHWTWSFGAQETKETKLIENLRHVNQKGRFSELSIPLIFFFPQKERPIKTRPGKPI